MENEKIVILLVCIFLAISSMANPVAADANPDVVLLCENVVHIDEDTFYIERIYVPGVSVYSNMRTGSKEVQYVYRGNLVFTLSVTGQFMYDGSSARATAASGDIIWHVSNVSLNSKNAYTSGASAIASASVSYLGTTLNKTVTLTCDANGNLS